MVTSQLAMYHSAWIQGIPTLVTLMPKSSDAKVAPEHKTQKRKEQCMDGLPCYPLLLFKAATKNVDMYPSWISEDC